MRIGIVVNNIETEWADYTTTHLAMEASNMGHDVWYIGVADFAFDPDENVHACALKVNEKKHRSAQVYLNELKGEHAIQQRITLDELDVLLLRNDPAEDVIKRPWARLAGINFGRLAMRHGVVVLNNPDGLLQAVNKMYLQYFPEEVRPRTLITRDKDEIKTFVKEQGGYAVLKPLSGSGGHNVFLVHPGEEPNINQMIEAVAEEGYVMAQEYLPEAARGDTRLFLVDGEPLLCDGKYALMLRARDEGDTDMRSNMTAGAKAHSAEMTDTIFRLAETVKPKLVEDGMFFVGLDIVGDKLMEINVFSPGGMWSTSRLYGANFFREFVKAIEGKVEGSGVSGHGGSVGLASV